MSDDTTQTVHTILAGAALTPTQRLTDATITLAGGRVAGIARTGGELPAGPGVLDARDGVVIPGLVDVQVNGALGWSFQAADRDHFDAIADFHLRSGTTTLLPTLVTAGDAVLDDSLRALAGYLDAPGAPVTLPGIHLEGPFLSPDKRGAHDPDALRPPDLARARRFAEAAQGRLAMLTLAPELPGAVDVIAHFAARGVVVAAGHSAAAYADMQRAVAAGLTFVTHAGNATDWPGRAMGPLGFMTSEPGVVGALLAEPTLGGSVILDGFHFHPALLPPLLRLKGPERLVLVSDASTVAGCPPGEYMRGGLAVTVRPEGFAASGRGGGWLAGSTITLLEAVRRAVALSGIPLQDAVTMATLGPARVLRLDGRKGQLRPGADADLLVLDRDLSLRCVIAGGRLVVDGR